jgi:2-dehydropantoate 2-reductase
MRIVVMGAGGVGGYFGGRLAQAGHEVTLIARGAHLAALRAKGLTISSPLGDATLKLRAVENPADAGTAEVVIFAVKLWDTEAAAEKLRPVLASGGVVLPFQNGVESIPRIASVLGKERVMGGAAYIAARIGEPGTIVHTGTLARLRFGAVAASQRAIAGEFHNACRSAGIEAELVEDIERVLWEKFVFLAALSGTTTLARAPLGVVRADPDLRWMLEAAMRETWQVARRRGIGLADDFVAQQLVFADGLPAQMKSSMQGDLELGGRLEVEWLSGAVARMAAEAGIEAPVNRSIYAALKRYAPGGTAR